MKASIEYDKLLVEMVDLDMKQRGELITLFCAVQKHGSYTAKLKEMYAPEVDEEVITKLSLFKSIKSIKHLMQRRISATLGGLISTSNMNDIEKDLLKSRFSAKEFEATTTEDTYNEDIRKWFIDTLTDIRTSSAPSPSHESKKKIAPPSNRPERSEKRPVILKKQSDHEMLDKVCDAFDIEGGETRAKINMKLHKIDKMGRLSYFSEQFNAYLKVTGDQFRSLEKFFQPNGFWDQGQWRDISWTKKLKKTITPTLGNSGSVVVKKNTGTQYD